MFAIKHSGPLTYNDGQTNHSFPLTAPRRGTVVVRIAADGGLLWSRVAVPTSTGNIDHRVEASAVHVAPSGEVVVTGTLWGPAVFEKEGPVEWIEDGASGEGNAFVWWMATD